MMQSIHSPMASKSNTQKIMERTKAAIVIPFYLSYSSFSNTRLPICRNTKKERKITLCKMQKSSKEDWLMVVCYFTLKMIINSSKKKSDIAYGSACDSISGIEQILSK